MVAKRIQKSLIHISKQLNESNNKFVLKYAKDCQAQANSELKYNFEKEDLKNLIESY